ncbi:hypothetical protein [Mesorhizobium sp. M0244]|uniref:hypothetical protein n=1 Tax=unclassified Mesorhizobium TaxID=325217 RepID=UPI00333BD270
MKPIQPNFRRQPRTPQLARSVCLTSPFNRQELPAQSTLAASHHPAVSDPDLLDAFNRDAAVHKWTVA